MPAKPHRRLKLAFAFLGMPLLIFFAVYAFFAWLPTGYEAIRAEVEAAPAAADRLRAKRPARIASAIAPPAFDEEPTWERLRNAVWGQDPPFPSLNRSDIYRVHYGSTSPFDDGELDRILAPLMLHPASDPPPFTAEECKAIHAVLDMAESLLLNQPSLPSGDRDAASYFQSPALLAIIRADERGDRERAVELLRNLLELHRRVRLQFFGRTAGPDHCRLVIRAVMLAGELTSLTDADFAAIDADLAAQRMDPASARVLRLAHAQEAVDAAAWAIRKDEVASSWPAMQYFFDGTPERRWRGALDAILENDGRRLIAAWSSDDTEAWESAETHHRRTLTLLEVGYDSAVSDFYRGFAYYPGMSEIRKSAVRYNALRNLKGEADNTGLELARMALAAIRFCRLNGRQPASAEKLQAAKLWAAPVDNFRIEWKLVVQAPRQRLVSQPPDGNSTELQQAYRAAAKLQQRDPDPYSPDDLRLYAKGEAQLDRWRSYFRPVPERAIYMAIPRYSPEAPRRHDGPEPIIAFRLEELSPAIRALARDPR